MVPRALRGNRIRTEEATLTDMSAIQEPTIIIIIIIKQEYINRDF